MKKQHLPLLLCVLLSGLISLEGGSDALAQAIQRDIDATVAQMDLSAVQSGFFLNLGHFTERQLSSFRRPIISQGRQVVKVSPSQWKRLYDGLVESDLRT